MSLSGRANVTFALKMSHFATVPMLLYRGKVTAEHLVDDCETTLNHHRNKSKVTYHTHTQITDKNHYCPRKSINNSLKRPSALRF